MRFPPLVFKACRYTNSQTPAFIESPASTNSSHPGKVWWRERELNPQAVRRPIYSRVNSPMFSLSTSANPRNRTGHTRIFSPVLYQLS